MSDGVSIIDPHDSGALERARDVWRKASPDERAQIKSDLARGVSPVHAANLVRSRRGQTAAFAGSENTDEQTRENDPAERVAGRAMGVANSLDFLGVADEARGAGAALASPVRAILHGDNPLKSDVEGAYRHARDDQRDAQRQLEEEVPGDVGTGQLVGTVAQLPLQLAAGPAEALTSAAKSAPGLLKLAGTGAALGAASGLGHSEGNVENQLGDAAIGGVAGGALGLTGGLIPKALTAAAPKAMGLKIAESGMDAFASPLDTAKASALGLVDAGGEAAGNAATKIAALKTPALNLAAKAVEHSPLGFGGALGGAVGHPVIGAMLGKAALGSQAEALASKLRLAGAGPVDLTPGMVKPPMMADEPFTPGSLTLEESIGAAPSSRPSTLGTLGTMADDVSPGAAQFESQNPESVRKPTLQLVQPTESLVPNDPDVPPSMAANPPIRALPANAGGGDWHLTPDQLRSGETPPDVQAELDALRSRVSGSGTTPPPPKGPGGSRLDDPNDPDSPNFGGSAPPPDTSSMRARPAAVARVAPEEIGPSWRELDDDAFMKRYDDKMKRGDLPSGPEMERARQIQQRPPPLDDQQALALQAKSMGIKQRFNAKDEMSKLASLPPSARQRYVDVLARFHGLSQVAPLAERFGLTAPSDAPAYSTVPAFVRSASMEGAHTLRQINSGAPWR